MLVFPLLFALEKRSNTHFALEKRSNLGFQAIVRLTFGRRVDRSPGRRIEPLSRAPQAMRLARCGEHEGKLIR
jgi:hypothetical protein